jgi:hypothetical protein
MIQDYFFGNDEMQFFNKIKIIAITPNVNTGKINKIINLKVFNENIFVYTCKKQSKDLFIELIGLPIKF